MQRYRKRPLEVQAKQWVGCKCREVDVVNKDKVTKTYETKLGDLVNVPPNCGLIDTLEGWHIISPGDFIVKGINGEIYPVKENIFKDSYDLIDEIDRGCGCASPV